MLDDDNDDISNMHSFQQIYIRNTASS